MAVTNSPRLGLPRWSEGTDLHPNRAEWDAQQGLLDDLVAIDVEVATYADRPEPKRGVYMWVVDEQRLYRATATGWMTTAKIGGGGRGSQIVVGANSAAVEGTSAYAARADHTHTIPLVTSAADGAMAKADKAKLDTSTASATNNAVAQRDSSGGAAFSSVTVTGAPTAASHAARKDYVDTGLSGRLPIGIDAGAGSANNILDAGQYVQPSATPVTVANGYPINGGAGSLLVSKFGSGASSWAIHEWTDWGTRRRFIRATNGGSGAWSAWRELAGTETATGSADGLMSAADKTILDAATITAVPSVLVKRDQNSQINVPSVPNSANHAVSRSYADASIASAVGAIPLVTSSTDGLMRKADKAKLDAAIYTAIADSLVQRDSGGRARFNTPVNGSDAANKSYTDSTASSAASAAVGAIPTATSAVDGLMPKADKAKLDSASNSSSTTSNIVMRGTDGRISAKSFGAVDQPSASADLTRKDYVDSKSSSAASAAVAGIPMATTGVNGLMNGVYADMLDYATYVESNSTLVRRSSTGIIDAYKFRGSAAPEYAQDLTRKDYVDSAVEAAAEKDTGWRDFTSQGYTNTGIDSYGYIKGRRKGDVVTLVYRVATASSASSHIQVLPGYTSTGTRMLGRPLDTITFPVPGGRFTPNYAEVTSSGSVNEAKPASAPYVGLREISWVTADPFPTSLPGTATSL